MEMSNETAVLGGGCFWCTEAVFQEVRGITSVESGYSGGTVSNPTYEEVCAGRTGHAESVRITFDPSEITYTDILEIFFETHDPTTMNRQGNDVGTQYRSVIFYMNQKQESQAIDFIRSLAETGKFKHRIVTEVEPFRAFYPAEEYHRNYYRTNMYAPYCSYVISPKLDKFRKTSMKYLKTGSEA